MGVISSQHRTAIETLGVYRCCLVQLPIFVFWTRMGHKPPGLGGLFKLGGYSNWGPPGLGAFLNWGPPGLGPFRALGAYSNWGPPGLGAFLNWGPPGLGPLFKLGASGPDAPFKRESFHFGEKRNSKKILNFFLSRAGPLKRESAACFALPQNGGFSVFHGPCWGRFC